MWNSTVKRSGRAEAAPKGSDDTYWLFTRPVQDGWKGGDEPRLRLARRQALSRGLASCPLLSSFVRRSDIGVESRSSEASVRHHGILMRRSGAPRPAHPRDWASGRFF